MSCADSFARSVSARVIARASARISGALFFLAITTLTARELPPIDALAQAKPVKSGAAQQLGSGPLAAFRGNIDQRLDIPKFLSTSPGAVRQSGASLLINKDPSNIARSYLKSLAGSYRITPAEVDDLPVKHIQRLPSGAAIVQFTHTINDIEVFHERASVLVNADGSLNSIGGYVSGADGIDKAMPQSLFRQDAPTAIATALQDFGFDAKTTRSGLRASGTRGNDAYFELTGQGAHGETLAQPARIKPVYFRTAYGLVPAWYAEISVTTPAGDDSNYAYVVSAKNGTLLYRQSLIANEAFSYRVWAETTPPNLPYPEPFGRNGTPHPTATPNAYLAPFVAPNLITLQNGPISTNDPWLAPGATQTLGNNVDAYADLDGTDGLTTTDYRANTTNTGMFDRVYDVTQAPQVSPDQVKAAITQAFYLTNWLHDWYYDDGFDEAAGNAQSDNYGRGGVAGDPLHVEVGNNPSRNNADMYTPIDGTSPRMQLFVYDGKSTAAVSAISPIGLVATTVGVADFGPGTFAVIKDVVYVNDGVTAAGGGTINDGCELPFIYPVSGKIAMIDRGLCSFVLKTQNAQASGAVGVLIVNNVAGVAFTMGGSMDSSDPASAMPILGVQQDDGAVLKGVLASGLPIPLIVSMQRATSVDRDAAIDDEIIAHEWGHYLSHRLSDPAGALASNVGGGMGEGYADMHALLLMVKSGDNLIASNTDFGGTYGVSSYVMSGPSIAYSLNQGVYFGIRRYPYSTDLSKNPLTFKYIQDSASLPPGPPVFNNGGLNSEVHNTGEVWASMLWECYASLLRDTPRLTFAEAQDRMKRYLIGGYEMMPPNSTFVDARDALLSVIDAQDHTDFLDCRAGFAKRGLGVGAVAPDPNTAGNEGVVESYMTTGNTAHWLPAAIDDSTGTCDADGQLDSRESGILKLQLHNDGFDPLNAATVSVSSTDTSVIFPQSVLQLSTTVPYATTTIPVPILLGNFIGSKVITLNYSATGPSLVNAPLTGQAQFQVNVDLTLASSDNFESPVSAWTPVSPDFSQAVRRWQRHETDATHHFAFGPDIGSPGLNMFESPAMQVSAAGGFSIAFKHNFTFDTSAYDFNAQRFYYYDGGVIEISDDNGVTWTDVVTAGATLTPGYNGTIYTGSSNPLGGRNAYVSTSGAGFANVTLNFGTLFQGKAVKLRFVIGSDFSDGGPGWKIDDFSASGITNLPFTRLIADPGHCIPDRIFADGFGPAP